MNRNELNRKDRREEKRREENITHNSSRHGKKKEKTHTHHEREWSGDFSIDQNGTRPKSKQEKEEQKNIQHKMGRGHGWMASNGMGWDGWMGGCFLFYSSILLLIFSL